MSTYRKLQPDHKKNFNTLKRAAENNDLALISAIEIATDKSVALICAVSWDGGEFVVTPLAQLFEGNPYEQFKIMDEGE